MMQDPLIQASSFQRYTLSFGRCLGDGGTEQECFFFNCFKSAVKENIEHITQ